MNYDQTESQPWTVHSAVYLLNDSTVHLAIAQAQKLLGRKHVSEHNSMQCKDWMFKASATQCSCILNEFLQGDCFDQASVAIQGCLFRLVQTFVLES